MTSLLLACCVLGMAGPPTLPPMPGQQTPPPAPPVRSGEQTKGAAKVSEVNLPEEFRDPSSLPPKAAEDGASTEAAVVTAPDQPPASPAPGERRSDAREVTTGADGPGPLGYEMLTAVRTAEPEEPAGKLTFQRGTPPPEKSSMLVLGYRQFAMRDGLGRDQTWHLVALEITPVRRYVRFSLHTEVGVEGGEAATGGDRADLMVLQKVGLGLQYPYWVTPFVEAQAGIGAARVELFERNDLAALYTVGLDAGVQWALLKHLHFVASVGWIRPYFAATGQTVFADRLTFRVGIGF